MNLAARSSRIRLLVSLAFLAVPGLLLAQAGSLDPSFGTNGIVTTAGTIAAGALQSDGKIVVAGGVSAGNTVVVRYNTNGTLDSTFGTGGQVTLSGTDLGTAFAVAIQGDGKILVGAPDNLELGIFRLNTNGSLDTSFGSNGVAFISPTRDLFFAPANGTIAPLADGKILVVALSTSLDGQVFERLLSNGTPDSTFGTNGGALIITNGQMAALQPNGQILVLALYIQGVVSRYDANGSLDPTFGGAGQAPGFGTGGGMAVIKSDSKFLVAGNLTITPSAQGGTTGFLVVRYTPNGTVDSSFGTNGITTTAFPGNSYSTAAAVAVALQPNGDVVAGGLSGSSVSTSDFALARYTASGTLDTTFGTNGVVTTVIGSKSSAISSLLIQRDGKILAFGSSSEGATIARYLSE